MMRAVNGSSIAATPATCGPALRRFAAGLRWRHVFGQSFGATLRWSLLLAVPLLLVSWLLPSQLSRGLLIAALILVPIALWTAVRSYWRGRKILGALNRSLRDGGDDLATLHDELATWLEYDEQAGQTPTKASRRAMLGWLERDVHDRLEPHRKRALAAVAKVRLGRWRWLLVVLIVLLLAWLVSFLLAPPWSGALGGLPNQATAGPQNGAGGGGNGQVDPQQVPGPGDPKQDGNKSPAEEGEPDKPKPEEPAPDKLPDPPQRPDEQNQDEGAESEDGPTVVPPLLELPDDQRFVVPEFIGDGPTRRARMHAAELEERQGGSRRDNATNNTGQAGGDTDKPKPSQQDFERAAERAQRARHVPEAERGIVRRFFDRLRSRSK